MLLTIVRRIEITIINQSEKKHFKIPSDFKLNTTLPLIYKYEIYQGDILQQIIPEIYKSHA